MMPKKYQAVMNDSHKKMKEKLDGKSFKNFREAAKACGWSEVTLARMVGGAIRHFGLTVNRTNCGELEFEYYEEKTNE